MSYIGLDNWKVGRTSAWTFANICKAPGKIGILMGNPRYRNQEMNETGFRSYFREHAPDFTLLEPISTFESAAVAQAFHARAITLAGESGQPEPEQDVASIMGYLDERWDKRIGAITSTASNLDWIAYCTELGHAYGVLPLPG